MKDNSILISEYIYDVLRNDEQLNDKVFPLIAPSDTLYPYIVFDKTITPVYTKNYLTENNVEVNFYIYSDDYIQTLELVNLIRNKFECKTYSDDKFSITQSHVTFVDESFTEDAYNQTLTIRFSVQ